MKKMEGKQVDSRSDWFDVGVDFANAFRRRTSARYCWKFGNVLVFHHRDSSNDTTIVQVRLFPFYFLKIFRSYRISASFAFLFSSFFPYSFFLPFLCFSFLLFESSASHPRPFCEPSTLVADSVRTQMYRTVIWSTSRTCSPDSSHPFFLPLIFSS